MCDKWHFHIVYYQCALVALSLPPPPHTHTLIIPQIIRARKRGENMRCCLQPRLISLIRHVCARSKLSPSASERQQANELFNSACVCLPTRLEWLAAIETEFSRRENIYESRSSEGNKPLISLIELILHAVSNLQRVFESWRVAQQNGVKIRGLVIYIVNKTVEFLFDFFK